MKSKLQSSKRRGVALIAALLIVTILIVMVGALLVTMQEELREVAYRGYENRALYAADAGVQAFLVNVDEKTAAGLNPTTSLTYKFAPDPNGEQAYFSWTMLDSGTVYNGLQYYAVQADGYVPSGTGFDHRRVTALLQQGSFSQYNYFGKNNAPGNYFVSGLMQFNGPVYLEGRSSSNPVNIQWYNNTAPIFLDKVIVSGAYQWWGPGHAKGAQPQTTADWNTVDAQGKNGVKFRASDFVSWPAETSSNLVANEAWAGKPLVSAFPTPPSEVYVNQQPGSTTNCGGVVATGIYVKGDAAVSMTSTPSHSVPSKQTFVFTPTGASGSIPKQVTVTIDHTNNSTTITEGTNTKTCVGQVNGSGGSGGNGANGAIFVNGKVTSLSGVVNGQYTLGVPDTGALSRNIVITGPISYHDDPQTCNCNSQDLLGLFANDVQVDPYQAPSNLRIEAAIFAGNKSEVTANSPDGSFQTTLGSGGGVCGGSVPNKGNLTVYGSLVNNYISPLGCFNASTGQLTHAYADQYQFDSRLKSLVPPFWPRTANYNIVAWRDVGV
jgi:hypothetical protein